MTRQSLINAIRIILERCGTDKTLETLENLMQCGFKFAKESGASMHPFIGASIVRSPTPAVDDEEMWNAYAEEVVEQIASHTDFADNNLGPYVLGAKSGVRPGRLLLALIQTVRPWVGNDISGKSIMIRHGR